MSSHKSQGPYVLARQSVWTLSLWRRVAWRVKLTGASLRQLRNKWSVAINFLMRGKESSCVVSQESQEFFEHPSSHANLCLHSNQHNDRKGPQQPCRSGGCRPGFGTGLPSLVSMEFLCKQHNDRAHGRGAVGRGYHTAGRRDVVRLRRDSCEQVANRLNPHTKADKQHIKCCDTCLQKKNRLLIGGWTLRHDDIRGFCSKIWEWYKLWEHRETKLHNEKSCGNTLCRWSPRVRNVRLGAACLVDRNSAKDEAQLADARHIELTPSHNFSYLRR